MNFNGCVSNKKLNLIDCYALYIYKVCIYTLWLTSRRLDKLSS